MPGARGAGVVLQVKWGGESVPGKGRLKHVLSLERGPEGTQQIPRSYGRERNNLKRWASGVALHWLYTRKTNDTHKRQSCAKTINNNLDEERKKLEGLGETSGNPDRNTNPGRRGRKRLNQWLIVSLNG